jgi:hypothetical protein
MFLAITMQKAASTTNIGNNIAAVFENNNENVHHNT